MYLIFRTKKSNLKHFKWLEDTYPNIKWFKVPSLVSVKSRHIDTLGDVNALCEIANVFKWTLDTWENKNQKIAMKRGETNWGDAVNQQVGENVFSYRHRYHPWDQVQAQQTMVFWFWVQGHQQLHQLSHS